MAPIYLRHVTGHTTLMAVREMLAVLHVREIKLGVVTNKPQAAHAKSCCISACSNCSRPWWAAMQWSPSRPRTAFSWRWRNAASSLPTRFWSAIAPPTSARHARPASVVLIRGGYTQIAVDDLGADLVLNRIGDLPAALRQSEAA
jgi:phosphoglycolate phosphatase